MKTTILHPAKKRIESLIKEGIPFTLKNDVLVYQGQVGMNELKVKKYFVKTDN